MAVTVNCGFKPDIFSVLGIGSGNKWRLAPTMYTVREGRKDDFGEIKHGLLSVFHSQFSQLSEFMFMHITRC